MSIIKSLWVPERTVGRALDALQPVWLLGARIYVSWQFLKAGYLKITSWDTTMYLFENEYHTPLLSPQVAAVAGTFGELFFPTLLILGFMGRLSALGLLAVNIMAVISYANVLLAEGSEAALGQHILWGTILVFLAVIGPGKLSVDHFIDSRRRP